MILYTFEERLSDSPFVERIWRTQSERTGDFLSVAAGQWEMVISRYQGETTLTVRGPETKPTPLQVTQVGGEFFGIIFKYGAFMPHFPVSDLVDGNVDLPDAASNSFWLNGSAWQFPTYENADTFVDRLFRKNLLVRDTLIESVLQGQPQELSPRSAQRRFLQATGLSQGSIRQIERARFATLLLQEGVTILDTVDLTGYADQAHLTRALKHFMGKTPTQITHKTEPEQMSLLFKTTIFG
jgi:AraC-like DNA-binding protein